MEEKVSNTDVLEFGVKQLASLRRLEAQAKEALKKLEEAPEYKHAKDFLAAVKEDVKRIDESLRNQAIAMYMESPDQNKHPHPKIGIREKHVAVVVNNAAAR